MMDILFPPKCVFCGRIIDGKERGTCSACLNHLERNTTEMLLSGKCVCRAAFVYKAAVRESLHRYKFGGASTYAPEYAKYMKDMIPPDANVLTWIPVSKQRKWERGFDQSELLAKEISKLTGIPVLPGLKKKNTKRQSAAKNAEQRKENIHGAFLPAVPFQLQGKSVLLIDDICTTGATLSEAVSVLNSAGVADISCLTFAMTERTIK